jgi:hypothetical protein
VLLVVMAYSPFQRVRRLQRKQMSERHLALTRVQLCMGVLSCGVLVGVAAPDQYKVINCVRHRM